MPKRIFVSHVSEEAGTAARLEAALRRDFLGLVDVFVSSDAEIIAAGEEWLRSVERALKDAALLVVLSPHQSRGHGSTSKRARLGCRACR